MEQRDLCAKVAVGKIIGRPTLESFHNVLVAVGWYHVWVMEASHPRTPVQWPDELESIYKLSQAVKYKHFVCLEVHGRSGGACGVQGEREVTCERAANTSRKAILKWVEEYGGHDGVPYMLHAIPNMLDVILQWELLVSIIAQTL